MVLKKTILVLTASILSTMSVVDAKRGFVDRHR